MPAWLTSARASPRFPIADEICSGFLPFQEPDGSFPFNSANQLYTMVVDGERPKLPIRTPQAMKHLMEQCWLATPTDRPNFRIIIEYALFLLRLSGLLPRKINNYWVQQSFSLQPQPGRRGSSAHTGLGPVSVLSFILVVVVFRLRLRLRLRRLLLLLLFRARTCARSDAIDATRLGGGGGTGANPWSKPALGLVCCTAC